MTEDERLVADFRRLKPRLRKAAMCEWMLEPYRHERRRPPTPPMADLPAGHSNDVFPIQIPCSDPNSHRL